MRTPPGYLVPDETVIYTSRRHGVVLAPAIVMLGIAWAAAGVLLAEAHRVPKDNLGAIGVVLVVLGVLYFASRVSKWWLSRYVITNMRIILIEGFVARQVKSLPLRLVIDTTYHRTVPGRVLGYCDLELNLSGQPGLRRLTQLPNADEVYGLILRLLSKNEPAAKPTPDPPGGAPPAPPGAVPVTVWGGPLIRSTRARKSIG